jgi:hypothetical protein
VGLLFTFIFVSFKSKSKGDNKNEIFNRLQNDILLNLQGPKLYLSFISAFYHEDLTRETKNQANIDKSSSRWAVECRINRILYHFWKNYILPELITWIFPYAYVKLFYIKIQNRILGVG